MNGVKIAFGILLLGVAIWLVERLLPSAVALLLWAGLAIGSALALGAMSVNLPQGWPRVRQAAGLLLMAWGLALVLGDRKSTRLNSSHVRTSYAVFCLKKKTKQQAQVY